MRAALGSHRTAHWFRPQSIVQVLINLPMRASCKKYSPRKSIMECDINSNGCNPGREMMCGEQKPAVFVETGTEIKSGKKIAAISQVMTVHLR